MLVKLHGRESQFFEENNRFGGLFLIDNDVKNEKRVHVRRRCRERMIHPCDQNV
jgi:hypothetical protein